MVRSCVNYLRRPFAKGGSGGVQVDAAPRQAETAKRPVDPAAALESLMDDYGSAVLRLAFFYLRDRGLAEDAAQETFVRAYRNRHTFRGQGSLRAWLMRIAANVCRDELRRLSRRGNEEPVSDLAEAYPAPQVDPADRVVARLEGESLLEQVKNLPSEIREAVFLYYYFDLSTVEIATTLGCPEGTVRSRLARGRRHLKEAMEKEGWRGDRQS